MIRNQVSKRIIAAVFSIFSLYAVAGLAFTSAVMSRENSPPSSPRACPSPVEFSPPTSPIRWSPVGSPACTPEKATAHSGSSSSPSPSASPLKRARKSKVLSRTSIQTKQRQQNWDDEDDDHAEDPEVNEANRCPQIPIPQDRNEERNVNVDDDFLGGQNLMSDSDSSSNDGNESDSSIVSDSDSSHSSSLPSNDSSVECDNSDRESASEDSGDTVEDLYEGSEMSANEALYHILKLYVQEHWTKTSLDKDIKLKKKLLPQPNALPSSGKAALKKLEELTSSCLENEYLYCEKCLQFVTNTTVPCLHVGVHSKFYSFPIRDQIKHMFEQRGLAAAIDSYRNQRTRRDGYLCDIVDGTEYIRIRQNLINVYDLMLLWNTDGVALSLSSKQELWIILCTICEISPRLRSSYVVVAGVYVGAEAPDMNVFLKPFVDSLVDLFEDGVQWVHPISKQTFVSKIVAPVFSADAPAKAKVLKCKNFNHRYGCVVCEQKSAKIPNPNINENKAARRPRHIRRFLYQDDVEAAQLRSGERMDLLGELAKRRGKSRKGVLGDAVVSDIPLSDRASCVSAEYMHLVLLGVVKYFLLLIFNKPGPWSLAHKLQEIDDFIMHDIKVPDFVTRLPRKIKDLKYWKASELRSFLLYYSFPIFKRFGFPHDYYQHWLVLVGAVHNLLTEAVSIDAINSAEALIRVFVRDIGLLYGNKYYLYNVHNLLHVCLLVRRWGPLWATSAFLFETVNGFLGKTVHGTKHLGKELINNIKISQSVAILENIVTAPRLPAGHQVSELLGKKWDKKSLTNEELNVIESGQFGVYVLYVRAKFKSNIFTCKLYDNNKKRSNSFVQFQRLNERPQFGEIIVFLKAKDGSFHCLVRIYKVVQVALFFHEPSRFVIRHVLPVESSDIFLVIPLECILTKLLKIGDNFALRPNTYEVNL